jgi:hypothetical protein
MIAMDEQLTKWFDEHPEWRGNADLVCAPPTAEEIVEEFPDASETEITRTADALTSFGTTRGAVYMLARRSGQTHRFAEMVAMQRPPKCMTDDVFFAGMPRLADQMGARQFAGIMTGAARVGFTPPADAVYHSGLARFQGDPEAFVTRAMGRGYIKSLCERRGWAVEGAVNVEARAPESDPFETSVPLANDLINMSVANMVRANPSLKQKSRKQLRDMAVDKFGPTK